MKIKNVEVWQEELKFTEPYTIAYETYSSSINIYVRIETNLGLSGFGCAAPDFHVTGETPETVYKTITEVLIPNLINNDPCRYIYLIEKLKKLSPKNPSALAAVDIALYDFLGKYAHLPVWKLLGGYRKKIATSVTIGIKSLRETMEDAEEYIKAGATILKLKGGLDVDADIEKLYKLREKYGRKLRLRFDANQGYSVDEALRFIKLQEDFIRLELLEQPVSSLNSRLFGKVTERSTIPIMADESILNLADAFHMVKHNFTDMINIKLMKTGGITEAMHINSVARAADIDVMTGCMDESALGIAAGLHFALSRPNVLYADLDSHFGLVNDPAAGIVKYKDGYLYPSSDDGFGWNGP